MKPYVLRYWESEFRWMAPPKSRSKQRLYRQRDIDVILLLKHLLYEERFTIAGARKRLRELGVARALEVPQLDLGLEIDHARALSPHPRRAAGDQGDALVGLRRRSTGAVPAANQCPVGP